MTTTAAFLAPIGRALAATQGVCFRGLTVGDRIVLEGIRQVRDGERVEYEFRKL